MKTKKERPPSFDWKARTGYTKTDILKEWCKMLKETPGGPSGKTVNRYNCNSCGNTIITKDVDRGTAPIEIPCDRCSGEALSVLYNTNQTPLRWSYEFYRPEDILGYLREHPRDTKHLMLGGLLLRKNK